MDNGNVKMSTEEAWQLLIEKYGILREIETKGVFHITANQIKEFREPRLMAKWDSSEQLPESLKDNNINILPDSRSSYVLGDFLLYENIPEFSEYQVEMKKVRVPDYESIDVDDMVSESNAINVLILARILDDFLNEENTVETFNGRMGTGTFDFDIDTERKKKQHINVRNAQCEIDGGFENENSVVILEAKNVVHKDFHIRQLYYPYRLWKKRVNKPIRLVFSIYSNRIFRLFEYEFADESDYSSIRLVQSKNYSLEDTEISLGDLLKIRKETEILYSDKYDANNPKQPPFIQADSFDRVVSLLENLYDNPMNDEAIAELMGFGYNTKDNHVSYRQSQYYYNAGKYLGLFTKETDGEFGKATVLTELGNRVFKMKYKERQLKLASLMLEHQIFAELFDIAVKQGSIPERELVKKLMRELDVCGESQIDRRSSSVIGWLNWILNLTKI